MAVAPAPPRRPARAYALKAALFATGLAGIVAEYVLSALATYFLGDATVQWALTISVMLFSMGLGSRLSSRLGGDLLEKFVLLELALSVLTAFSSLTVYTAAAFTPYVGAIVYGLSVLVGLLIGLEIPLVVRLNETFETLRVNIASVMEKDYYGSLLGGLFFAFVGLPYLGLTYTPFLLGAVNLLVAAALLRVCWPHLPPPTRRRLGALGAGVALALAAGALLAEPVVLFGEQRRYRDRVVYAEQSRYQRIVMTRWQDDHWLFLDGHQQLSTLDEAMYHEPLVHPALALVGRPQDVLVLGGGDGCAAREILKHPTVRRVTVVDLDPAVTRLGRTHPVLTALNDSALHDPRVRVTNADGFRFLETDTAFYDAIVADLPDPRSVTLSRLYSVEFYRLVRHRLRPRGVFVTQAGSPYYATEAFRCIDTTLQAAGFTTARLHHQVLTLGEWGFVVGARAALPPDTLRARLRALTFAGVPTRWLNQEAMLLVTSFGKNLYARPPTPVEVNRVRRPVLFRYYRRGNWDLY